MIPGIDLNGIDLDFSHLKDDRQTISVTDLIAEGPIYGLVDGAASVYLNDDRAVPLSEASNYYSQSAARVTLTNGSTSAVITGAGAHPIIQSETGDKYLIVRAAYGTKQVAASNGSAGTDNYAITATLTTSDGSAFFTDSMISTPEDVDTHVPARLGLMAAGGVGDGAFGEGWITKRTSSSVAEFVPGGAAGPSGLWVPDGSYWLEVDKIAKISAISGTTVILESAWSGNPAGYPVLSLRFDVTGAIVKKLDPITQTKTTNHEGITTQFRVGTLAQTPFSGRGGHGSTSISNSPSAGGALIQSSTYDSGSGDAPKVLIGSSNSGFKLTASQLQEVDEARFTIAYSNGHYAVNGEGSDRGTFTQYRTMIAVKKPGESSFEAYQVLKHPLVHQGIHKNAVTFVETIDLTAFRPFSDFKIQVERITDHQGDAYKTQTEKGSGWNQVTSAALTNTTCVIKDILAHPFTALGKVTFDTKKFTGMPTRSYHVRGLKVSVPSNYITREQASDGVATYNRNTTSGATTTSYQDWDGAFASEKLYTNNPAWVFYDILTNNRYGLGDFLKDTDIDKYALYRISRYCDALVDDGKGGLEPRFTANLYFTKAADAYKVLKDIATVFRSMLYYIDGQVVPIIDAPSGPVYNFTKANVLEGKFAYEGTGSKTRINQCIVTWIDPEANYKASPLIVEDRLNIAKTGTIISQNAMAMGAISEGQALRYGRWKLWTAANQREVVSFSTALNATFLMPGDIVNIQDADRYAVRIGGRVSNSGTDRSVTSIPLDSTTTLVANSTYNLSVMFVEPGAFTTEDVTISGVDYKKGDLVKQAFIDSNNNGTYTLQNIDSEIDAINAKATAAGTDALVLSWSETTRVETQEVSTVAGDVETLTVATAFSAIPSAEAIWVLTETAGGQTVIGSAKEYKVLAISQNSKNEFNISAVEHYDEKFSAVDEDFTTYIADTVYPAVRPNDIVPPVRDVSSTSRKVTGGKEIVIQWLPPLALGAAVNAASGAEETTVGLYEQIAGYEIIHTFPGIQSPVSVNDTSQTSFTLDNVLDGTYEVAVKVVNTLQNVSVAVVASVTVSDEFDESIPRLPEGVPYTGDLDSALELSSSGSFTINTTNYIFNHPSPYAAVIQGVNATTATHTQDCSNMTVTTKIAQANEGEFIVEHYYVMLDSSDTSDRLKLLKYYKPATGGPSFWYDTGTGNTTDKYGSNLTGTFLKAGDSSKVVGTGTSFLSEIKAGDVLQLGTEDIRVASVKSDTILFLSSATSTAHNGVTGKIPNIRIDKKNDCVIARIYKTGANAYSRFNYAKRSAIGSIDGIDGDPALSARLTANQYVIPYDSTDNETTTITLTATATNFEAGNRVYKFYVDNVLKQTTTNASDSHTFVLADGDEPANGAQKTIKLEIIQGSTTAIDSTSIYGVKDGESAFTVVFTNEAHTISADEGGAPLTFANSGTDIRVFKGSTRLTYATSGANTFEVAVLSDTDITVNASPTTEQFAIANDTRRYGPASGMANADTSASITYSITARSDDAIDTVLTKVQSFTKGNAGPGAKVVNLTASQYVIPYDLANDETTTITLTATAKNISGSKIYKIYVNNTLIPGTGTTGGTQTTTGNAVTCNIPQNLEPSHGEQITVRVDVIQASAIISSDSTSIYGIKDGDDSFTAILTNEAHAIAASFNGTPKSFADSGTDIRVFHGSTALTYGTGPSNFSVSAAPSGITVGNASTETFGVSNDTRRFASASGMANSASKASIVFTITARNQEGVATTLVKVQSFTKGKDGTGISSVTKSNDTVTVTFEDNTTDTFTVNGVTSVAKSGNTLTITYDDGSTSTIDDGTQGNGISNVTRSGETVTVTYDDSTTQTFTVADGTSAVSGDPEYVTVSNIKKNAAGTYTVSFLDIDYIFRQGSSIVAKRRYRVTRSADTWSTTVATRDQDTSDELNVSRLTPALTISNNNAVLKVAYSDGSIASSASAPVSVILDGLGISSVGKVGDTITVTYDNSSTDTFTVNGVASVAKSGDTLTITYDDGSTSTIDDGEQGNGIASISKSGETVTVTFDDNSSTTFSVADGAASVSGDPDYVVSSAITKNTSGVYSANHLDLDFTFREGGATTLAKRRYRIARSSNTWATSVTARDADISDELNVSRLTPTVTVTGQNAVVKVTYSHGGVTSTASAPVSIANDAIGTKTVQLFKKDDSTFLNTTAGNYASPTTGVDSGWTTTQETPANGEAIYMVSRTFNSDGLNQSNWSAPIIVAQRTDGTTPAPGAPGLRTIQGYLYYEKNSANAPADPSGTTYTFSTGLVSGGSGATEVVAPVNTAVNKWTNSPRTQDPTSSHDHYTIRYFGTESSASSSTITVTYSDAVPYTNFDGVVTFSNGTFKEGTANITTIDGGNISTGTIDAHRLSVGKTAAQLQAEGLTVGSRVLLLEDSLKIFSGTTLRVHIGNLSNTDT